MNCTWSYFLDSSFANDFEWVPNLRRQIFVNWWDKFNDSFICQENIQKLYIFLKNKRVIDVIRPFNRYLPSEICDSFKVIYNKRI